MLSILLTFLPLACGLVVSKRQDTGYGVAFGNAFSTGPVADNSWIREATTTLVLPELNNPHVGNMALWPGMGTSGGDLIQGLAISTVGYGSPCNMAADELKWCVTASTLESERIRGTIACLPGYNSPLSENQEDGSAVTASPGDEATCHCEHTLQFLAFQSSQDTDYAADKYNDATAMYDQTVSINGEPISTLSTGI